MNPTVPCESAAGPQGTRQWYHLLAALGLALCFGVACAGSSRSATAPTRTSATVPAATRPSAGANPQPVIASSELVVGQNRFTLGILNRSGTPVPDAQVHLQFFELSGAPGASGSAQGTLRFEKVLAQSTTPAIGSPVPPSHNLTVKDVSDLSVIDTSAHPSPDMHTETIADAIAAHRPILVLFATPGYCTSRLCGPELELTRKLESKYQGKVDFIHVEIYKDPATRTPMPTVEEWHLQSEPWVFVVDRNGIISDKFEGPTTLEEMDTAVQKVAD